MLMIQTRGGTQLCLKMRISVVDPVWSSKNLATTQQPQTAHKQTSTLGRYRWLPARKQCMILHKPQLSTSTRSTGADNPTHNPPPGEPWLVGSRPTYAVSIISINYLSGHGRSSCNPHNTPSFCLYTQSCFQRLLNHQETRLVVTKRCFLPNPHAPCAISCRQTRLQQRRRQTHRSAADRTGTAAAPWPCSTAGMRTAGTGCVSTCSR